MPAVRSRSGSRARRASTANPVRFETAAVIARIRRVEPSPPPEPTGRALLGPGLFVGGAVIAANGLNAAFQIALARILEPSEYSLLVALVVVTLIAAVPPLAFQAAVAREVAVALAEGRR